MVHTNHVPDSPAGAFVPHPERGKRLCGTPMRLARNMHPNEVANLLEQTLKEEKQAGSLSPEAAGNRLGWQALERENGGKGRIKSNK